MTVVISHNIAALNAYDKMAAVHKNLSKAIEKFSSGFRVNSAADDAAGLAVSEKLRAQMKGVDQAVANAQDGMSLIQTADGALAETQDILNRMRELSVQAANGTLTAQDRSYIQYEVSGLREEVTRIANTTQFNKKKLLNGNAAGQWSSDKTATKAIIRGGLRDEDLFGQKTSFEGNFRIDIQAVPGQNAVMKTKIFTHFEEVDYYTYVGSGNYRDDNNKELTASEAAKALDGYYSFTLINKENQASQVVWLRAEAGQFSNMSEVAQALNEGALEDTEYTAYFDSKAGALAIRARGHDFDVSGNAHDIGKLFGVSYYAPGIIEGGGGNTIDVVIPTTPTIPTPPSQDAPGTPTVSDASGDLVVDTTTLTYDHTYDSTEAVVNITADGVYKISGSHDSISVADGVKATIVLDAVSVNKTTTVTDPTSYGDAAFTIGDNAEVDLALVKTTTLTSGYGRAGLEVEETGTVRVYNNTAGNGTLNVNGGYYGAAIGSAGNINADPSDETDTVDHNAGNIIIYSGNINAKALENGHFGAAGIGGGIYGNGGYVAIHGGTVRAEGTRGGAGIGSGRIGHPDQDSAADILITGGTITAIGHEGGAGIGGGSGSEYVKDENGRWKFDYLGTSSPSYGRIVITGGDITAYGSGCGHDTRGGAGIGGGEYNIGGEIIITGGKIKAQGFSNNDDDGGAGIGGGAGGPDVNPEFGNGGKIFITGGEIEAIGGSGWASSAGIGGGNRGTAGEIIITGGTITATGGNNQDMANGGGAGIGAGSGSGYINGDGEIIVDEAGKIYILGGTVTAQGGFDAAGIGDGGTDKLDHIFGICASSGGEIVIAGGTVTATGGVSGAGVGGGNWGQSGTIRIQEGLTVNATRGYSNYSTTDGGGHPRTPSEDLQKDIGHGDHVTEENDDVQYGNIRVIDPADVTPTPSSRGKYTDIIQTIAESNTNLSDVLELENDAGNPLLSEPQTITITRGDGTQSRLTLYADDNMDSMTQKLNMAISGALGTTGSGGMAGAYSSGTLKGDASERFVAYVAPTAGTRYTSESVEGTMLFRSLPCGVDGALAFSGNRELLDSLGLNLIQEAKENQFIVNITDAHTGEAVARDIRITGNKLNGVLHKNVDIEFDPMAGIEVKWNDEQKLFEYSASKYTTYLHLADNTTVLQVGANEGEDLALDIGDMSAHALGLDAVNVTNRASAARAITLIDRANDKVSAQRSKLGAYQNRLDHTIGRLSIASENLMGAYSRIRDTDMAKEAMNFAKLQILVQSGNSMLSQANQLPQNVMSLMR
ncbi:MAG: hypothetical protein K6E38_08170 [Fretibacterium sp.]|nr:hypothetical protein [Fretibacterium sp.]